MDVEHPRDSDWPIGAGLVHVQGTLEVLTGALVATEPEGARALDAVGDDARVPLTVARRGLEHLRRDVVGHADVRLEQMVQPLPVQDGEQVGAVTEGTAQLACPREGAPGLRGGVAVHGDRRPAAHRLELELELETVRHPARSAEQRQPLLRMRERLGDRRPLERPLARDPPVANRALDATALLAVARQDLRRERGALGELRLEHLRNARVERPPL